MSIFDSHAHYLSSRFDGDREELLKAVFGSDVSAVVECATDARTIEEAAALAGAYPGVFCALGVHPHSANEYSPALADRIRELSRREKVVAVGEIGLDYHYDFQPRDIQKKALAAQLELAKALRLPVSLHSRESTADMLAVLKEHAVVSGVMHCFSGSPETAEIILDMGLYIGIGGSVTFKGAVKAVEVVRQLPLDRLLLETDCPYLTPVPHRGERNDSRTIRFVAHKIAQIKDIGAEEVLAAAERNAKKLFHIA